MKDFFLILLFSCFIISLSSCKPQRTETQETPQTEQDSDGVWELPNYAYTDSLMQGSHKVVFTITSQPDEELPEVVDEDGVKYRDNRWQLVITKDGSQLFNRSFTTASTSSL